MEAVSKPDAPAEFGTELRSMFIRQKQNNTIDALIVAEDIQALRELCRQR